MGQFGRLAVQVTRTLTTSSNAFAAESPALATKTEGGATNLASMLGFGSTRIDTPLSVSSSLLPSVCAL